MTCFVRVENCCEASETPVKCIKRTRVKINSTNLRNSFCWIAVLWYTEGTNWGPLLRFCFAPILIYSIALVSCHRKRPSRLLMAPQLCLCWAREPAASRVSRPFCTSILYRQPFGSPRLHASPPSSRALRYPQQTSSIPNGNLSKRYSRKGLWTFSLLLCAPVSLSPNLRSEGSRLSIQKCVRLLWI